MADAPTYGQPRVATQPLSVPRENPNAPAAAFGVPKSVDLTGAANQVGDLVQRHQDNADALAVNMHAVALGDLRTGLLTHAVQQKGLNAIQASNEVTEAWKQHTDELIATLPNERQQRLVAERAAGMWANLHEAVESHAAAEISKADAATADALNAQYLQGVVLDPASAASAIEHTIANTRSYGARAGWTPEVMAKHVADHVSDINATVVSRLVAQGTMASATLAQEYLDAHRTQFVGAQLGDAEKLVDEGLAQGAGQQAASAILGTSGPVQQGQEPATTMSAALARAEQIQDPKERKAATQAIVEHYRNIETARRLAKEASYENVGAAVESGTPIKALRLTKDWLSLDVHQKEAYEKRADAIAHPERTTNMNLYRSLQNSIALGHGNQVLKTLGKYHGQLSDADEKALGNAAAAGIKSQTGKEETRDFGEEKRLRLLKEKEDKKAAAKTAHDTMIRDLMNGKRPDVPGAPIVKPTTTPAPVKGRTTGLVPASWIDHAVANDPEYADYLQQMGVDLG